MFEIAELRNSFAGAADLSDRVNRVNRVSCKRPTRYTTPNRVRIIPRYTISRLHSSHDSDLPGLASRRRADDSRTYTASWYVTVFLWVIFAGSSAPAC
jgi:hypothetical protein